MYKGVILDVLKNVRDKFLNEGVDEQVLQELKQVSSLGWGEGDVALLTLGLSTGRIGHISDVFFGRMNSVSEG